MGSQSLEPGQAPHQAVIPASGQVPDPQTPPQAGPANEPKSRSIEEYEREIEKLRKENAASRVKSKELDALLAEKKTREEADLSAVEKATKRAEELEQKYQQSILELQQERIRSTIEKKASSLGFADTEDAYLGINLSEVEYDKDGRPENIDKLLERLAKAKPHWIKQNFSKSNAGGATNPSKTSSNAEPLTMEMIGKMTAQEYDARRPEIQAFLNGRALGRR